MAIAQWLLHFDLIWQNWSRTMKSVFSQENRSCHRGTDHLSIRRPGPTHGGSKSLSLCLHPMQLLISYHGERGQDFSLLLTDSHFTPYGTRICFPWNFWFSTQLSAATDIPPAHGNAANSFWSVLGSSSAHPKHSIWQQGHRSGSPLHPLPFPLPPHPSLL